MTSGRSLSLLASIAALALAIATALSLPSAASADHGPFGGPCVKITMVSADASYKLHLVKENSARLGLNNRQVGSSAVVKTPERIGILIDHTGEVKWEHKDLGNGQMGFEDHIDNDFNDAVIRVEPVSCPSRRSNPAPPATPRPVPTATALEVSFGEATHSASEGNSVTVTVNVSPDADREVEIPVSISDDAEAGDYQVSGLTGGKLSFASGDSSASFTISTVDDADRDDETLDLSFGTLPTAVSAGEQATAQVTIEDTTLLELEVSFEQAAYTVNEGNSVTVTVNVLPDADREVEISVSISDDAEAGDYQVSGLTGGELSFASGDSSASFTISTVDDADRDDETLDLSFGTLPTAVSAGTQATAQVTIEDNTPAPRVNRRSVGGNSGVSGGFGFAAQQTNQPPVFTEGVNAVRSVPENAEIPTNVGSPVLAMDLDRDTLTYTLGGPDAASFSLDSGTGQLKTAIELDYETKASYFVILYAHDARGGRATIVVAVRVIDVAEQEVVFDAPAPTPEPQPLATATPEPTPTAILTAEPTSTPTPEPTSTSVPTPTVSFRWPWQSQTPDSTPEPSATAMSTSTPGPDPTEEPTTVPEDTSDSQSAMFAGSQGGGPLGDPQPLAIRSSVAPLPEEPRHLLIWPIVLVALGLAVMVIGTGMLISGGRKRRRRGNRDFIMNS